MPRTLRLTAAGAWHHVMNRGAGRKDLFLDDEDAEGFLGLLGECRPRWGLVTHAAVLMPNHFHLLVEDPERLLSRAMRHVHGVYTLRFNRRHGRDGALTRGRFKSRLVDSETYLAELVRYIHANPVQAGLAPRARAWPWSSHRHYLAADPASRPGWLETAEVLARFGGDTKAGRAALDRFVHARVPEDVRAALAAERWYPVLGDESFVADTRAAVRADQEAAVPGHRALERFVARTPAEVVAAVATVCGCPEDAVLRAARGERNLPRQLALLICAHRLPATAREVAAVFGLHPTTVASAATRIRRALEGDEAGLHALGEALELLDLRSSGDDEPRSSEGR